MEQVSNSKSESVEHRGGHEAPVLFPGPSDSRTSPDGITASTVYLPWSRLESGVDHKSIDVHQHYPTVGRFKIDLIKLDGIGIATTPIQIIRFVGWEVRKLYDRARQFF